MDRPDITRPPLRERPVGGPPAGFRLVARTQSIEEAEGVAQRYQAEGYQTMITKKAAGGVRLYEVWAGKGPDILSAGKE